MKRILFFVMALVFVSCTEPYNDPSHLPTPALVSSIPANNDNNISDGLLTVVLTFDQNVFSPSAGHSSISIVPQASIGSVVANGKNVSISLSGLHKSTTYTLTVPSGVIVGPGSERPPAPQISITFRTVDSLYLHNSIIDTVLCTPNPSPEAVKVYRFLLQQYGTHILSGAMARVAWNTDEADMVYAATGKYPAINTVDYIHLWASPANWIDYSQTSFLETWWNSGGIVSAGWHWNVPTSNIAAEGDVTFNTAQTTFRPANALVEGTWENTVMKSDLAKIAGYLKLLRDKNIPVLWRPLHEAAGNIFEYNGGTAWFWWGRDGGAAYIALWRYMFDYFQQQGLNNLIWIWTTQTKDNSFYPGDNYVDITGRDIYDQAVAESNFEQFVIISNSNRRKMITLSECGNVGLISAQWAAGARWSFFMPWYDYNSSTLNGHQYATTAWWQDAVSNPAVITKDKMPDLK